MPTIMYFDYMKMNTKNEQNLKANIIIATFCNNIEEKQL